MKKLINFLMKKEENAKSLTLIVIRMNFSPSSGNSRIVMTYERNVIYSSISFHGIELGHNKLQSIYKESISWINSHGYAPDKASIYYIIKWSKVSQWKSVSKKINKDKFSKIKGFSIYCIDSDISESPGNAALLATVDPINGSLFLGKSTENGLIWSLSSEEYIKNILKGCVPKYAYGFLRESKKGTFFYTCGIIVGLSSDSGRCPDADEVSRITRWGSYGVRACKSPGTVKNAYEIGDLRDLYPWNYLTEAALNRKIEGTALLQWIQENPTRGELKPVGNEGFIWRLTDEQIAATRPAMIEADILFDPRPIEYLDHVTWAREARERLGYRGE